MKIQKLLKFILKNETEFSLFCVLIRYAQSLVMGAFSYQQQPWNEYLLITSK